MNWLAVHAIVIAILTYLYAAMQIRIETYKARIAQAGMRADIAQLELAECRSHVAEKTIQ